jgi:DNA polymerase I-like protein with 3'-5' exonuclease and polymerase domains
MVAAESVKLEVPWRGRPLSCPDRIGWDTETEVVDLTKEIPTLVCLTAADHERKVVVFPHQLIDFIETHLDGRRWGAWNLGFDWWVVHKELSSRGGKAPLVDRWLAAVDSGWFGDDMLLEQLVRLGEGRDNIFFQLSLQKAAKAYLGVEIEKDADIRKGFDRRMVVDGQWRNHMEFWRYAADDAHVTYLLDSHLTARAKNIQGGLPSTTTSVEQAQWGLLTEQIQVKAAISLMAVTRNGIRVDRDTATKIAERSMTTATAATAALESRLPGLIKVYGKRARKAPPGSVMYTKSGLPQLSQVLLREYLQNVAIQHGLQPPRTAATKNFPDGQIQTAAEWWTMNCPDEPLIKEWAKLQTATASLEIVNHLKEVDRAHAVYEVMKRTGRTSAKRPPIQQTPRDGEYRALFLADPGTVIVAADYSAIELRTLAGVCEKRLGKSVLADILRDGVDPHAYTARLLLGLSQSEWNNLGGSVKKAKRQAAKALNFGIPGGLGAKKLRAYAKANYGVDLSDEEARNFRHRVITDVYPEWSTFLLDGLGSRLSVSMGTTVGEVERYFGTDNPYNDPMGHPAVKLIAGVATTKTGEPYHPWYSAQVWSGFEACVTDKTPKWVADRIFDHAPGEDLASYLIQVPSVTLTGRSRKKALYGEYRNTQFQGLASDGGKLALWELHKAGYQILAFIHDEILTQVNESEAKEHEQRIAGIMSTAFARVMPDTGIPILVEVGSGPCWKKP